MRYNLQDVKSNSLRERSTLTDNYNISFFYLKARTNVNWNISMSLLKSVVLLDVMQIISSYYYCSVHLCRYYHSFQNLFICYFIDFIFIDVIIIIIYNECYNGNSMILMIIYLSSDGDIRSKRTLFVYILTVNSFLRSLES